uniref:Uncharacterized protein n=1 Tax=Anopheles funestus TaxID=62324 RepID=A0A182R5I1_ANOFN
MSARKLRKTGSLYKIAATNDANLERELSGISSRANPRNSSEISNSVDPNHDSEIVTSDLPNESVQDTTHQTHHALNGLLEILREKTEFSFPKDARTLLQTPKGGQQIVPIAGGEFWYQGIKTCLLNYFGCFQPTSTTFSLNISIDGLPLHKSSRTEFWPILINIHEKPKIPCMVVGIFSESSKPRSKEAFSRPLVTELTNLTEHGIIIAGKLIQIRVRAFIADSPARAFIKGTASYNAKAGCLKCTVRGQSDELVRVVYFPYGDAAPRTDENSRNFLCGAHQIEPTPVYDLPQFDLIKQVSVSDQLHLSDLGVTRKLLMIWIIGKHRTNCTKWSNQECVAISSIIKKIKHVHRKLRGLDHLTRWKGTEFTTFCDIIVPEYWQQAGNFF